MKPAMKYACASLALAVSLATIVATLATAQQPTAAVPRPVETADPIELFTRMMPVFSHARCANCHGGVNPFDTPFVRGAIPHPPGFISSQSSCPQCHNATQEIKDRWRSAMHEELRFFGKNAKQMCDMQSGKVWADTRPRYYRHLETDPLIVQSFDGMAGGAREAPDLPDPPPMKHGPFLVAGKAWLDSGALCGRWNGKLTQTETFRSSYSYPMSIGNGSTTSVQEIASRQITIWRKNGVTTGSVNASGSSTIINTMRFAGPNGPCTAVATSTGRWNSTSPPDGQPDVSITIQDNGGSTIRFATPAETGNSSSRGDMVNDCSIPIPAGDGDEPPVQLEWPSWVFMIRCPSDHAICQLFDPEQPRLSGIIERTIADHSDAAEPQSWLSTGPVGISRSDDGTSIPVKVTTTWDLTLED